MGLTGGNTGRVEWAFNFLIGKHSVVMPQIMLVTADGSCLQSISKNMSLDHLILIANFIKPDRPWKAPELIDLPNTVDFKFVPKSPYETTT